MALGSRVRGNDGRARGNDARERLFLRLWVPASAGMTEGHAGMTRGGWRVPAKATSFPRTREPREKQSTSFPQKPRHSRGRGNPGKSKARRFRDSGPGWARGARERLFLWLWVPASAGMTEGGAGMTWGSQERGRADVGVWVMSDSSTGWTPIWSRYQRRSVDRQLIPCPFPWRRAFNPLNARR